MEHQTIIAMGPKYELKYPAYNSILFHEICHEWFGNMVTSIDWKDYWIQESLTGYMEALYEEELNGDEGYTIKIESFRKGLENRNPLAPMGIVNSREIYSGDSYKKGAYLLHTLRYLIGKENLLEVLRLMAYPDKALQQATDGSQCRFTTTDEFFKIIEDVSQQNFDWFEEVYFRSAELPKLEIKENKNGLQFEWVTINNMEFNMPLELETHEGIETVDFVNNLSKCMLSRNEIVRIDPKGWILFDLKE
jgi:aminopeptidase N